MSVDFEISLWFLQFPPKNEIKQVNLRFYSDKIELISSFFGGKVDLEILIQLCLTFKALVIDVNNSVYDSLDQVT